jgi:superfamily II DNA or RNA helicase
MMKQMNSKMPIEFLHGKNKKELNEEKVKQDFADGKVKILISTLFDEGVDIPKIDAVVDAGGGRSAIKALQLTGRAMRKYEGKTKAFIFMFIQPYTHLYKHSKARAQILQTEPEFDVRLMEWQE